VSRVPAALAIAGLALAVAAPRARAWESSTHAGLTEAAATGSHLHARLVELGFSQGLFEPLTIPPADAAALIAAIKRYPPTDGFTPDARGRQFALGWLVAGSVIADDPFAADHFYDPTTGSGWTPPSRGAWSRLSEAALDVMGRTPLPGPGVPAPDWIVDKRNPLGLAGFLDQYAKAVRGATPGERSRAMAGALVAAGAILHVLEDMGSPAHVRGDARAFLDPVGPGRDDLGSRFERIAALAFGRLGVPAPARVVTRATLRGFFTAGAAGTRARGAEPGLADEIASRWFSEHTLPAATRIGTGGRTVSPRLARPRPRPPARLNLMAASQDQGTTLSDADGVCLARYRVSHGVLSFWLDDDCMLDEAQTILPEVSSYAAGALDFLFRGELTVKATPGRVDVAAKGALGAGKLEVLAEDERGVRTSLATKDVARAAGGAALLQVAPPAGARRVVALFTGADGAGEPVVAVGAVKLVR
jgi:hypothetical protein